MKMKLSSWGKFLSRVFKIFCIAVLIALMGVTVYIMVCTFKGKPVEIAGRSIMKVMTGSMEPSIHEGDYILIKRTDVTALEPGDIICFYSEDSDIYGLPNTHRIVEILPDGSFVTRGDANSAEDSTTVSPERVIGIYSGKLRFFRWLGSFSSLKKLFMIFVMIPCVAIAAYEAVTIAGIKLDIDREKKQQKQQETEARIRVAIDREKEKLYNQMEDKSDRKVTAADDSGKDNEG